MITNCPSHVGSAHTNKDLISHLCGGSGCKLGYTTGGQPGRKVKLAQHTTPIAKTHRTATFFASEPTEKLKMFINTHHPVNITIPSPKHHRSIATHHRDTKASPTQSRDTTNTKPTHHPHITKTSQHNHYTSPGHTGDITDTSLKDHQNITSTCRKHLDTSPKNH